MAEPHVTWDMKALYNERIAPLMEQIYNICREYDLPFEASVQVAEDEASITCHLPRGHTATRILLAALIGQNHPAVEPMAQVFQMLLHTGIVRFDEDEGEEKGEQEG